MSADPAYITYTQRTYRPHREPAEEHVQELRTAVSRPNPFDAQQRTPWSEEYIFRWTE